MIKVELLPDGVSPSVKGDECAYCAATLTAQDIAAELQVIQSDGDCDSYYHASCLARYEAELHAAVQPLRDTLLAIAPLDVAQLPTANIPTEVAAASLRWLQLKGNNVEAARMRELLGYGWAARDAGYQLAELLTAKLWVDDDVKVLVEGWGLHERLSQTVHGKQVDSEEASGGAAAPLVLHKGEGKFNRGEFYICANLPLLAEWLATKGYLYGGRQSSSGYHIYRNNGRRSSEVSDIIVDAETMRVWAARPNTAKAELMLKSLVQKAGL